MTAPTPGQVALLAYDRAHGVRVGNWKHLGPTEHAAWEAAAAAIETEQVRLARQDRDQLRKHVLALAAGLENSAAATAPSKKSGIETDLAAKLRQVAEPPS